MDREVLEVDVLFVGGGPANLACALHIAKLFEEDGGFDETLSVLIEKGGEIGSHAISGAVMDPRGIRELIPDFLEKDCPVEAEVGDDDIWYLGKKGKLSAFWHPKPLRNHGNYVVSLGELTRWMGGLVEETGRVEVFPEFPGSELLIEDGKVVGVRTGDRGIDRHGEKKPTYEPGIDIRAKVTVLGEGAHGSLAKQLIREFDLGGKNPQVYALGVKELWQMPEGAVPPGRVYHTLGWPLPAKTFGGGFIYGMKGDVWDVGFVTGLDYEDPHTDPHGLFQAFKTHPAIAPLLEGGKMIQYGAKTIPEGGWFSRPKSHVPGALLIGDTGGNLNPLRLKGIHTAMKTGMLAAETILAALKEDDFSDASLGRFEEKVCDSWVYDELWASRNIHQGFEKGRKRGLFSAWWQIVTGGKFGGDKLDMEPGHERMQTVAEAHGPNAAPFERAKYDGEKTFNRLDDVYASGTKHEEDQPPHLVVTDPDICRTKCAEEYDNPCTRFCPAEVYEMEEDPERGGMRLRINAGNCVHCKTCDIMDPYQIIDWTVPEGGGGPRYHRL
ncbi:MAG: electron transfer flavoprotein-ubiquinone oxidoreductase [Planctomycetota bacterium]